MAGYLFRQVTRPLLAGLYALAVAGCGGGGSSPSPPTPPPMPPVNTGELPIDADNVHVIAGGVLGSITSTIELLELTNVLGLQPLTSAADSPVLTTGPISLPPGPGIPVIDDLLCVTGRVSMVWNDADNSQTVTTGDNIGTAFVRCEYTDPAVIVDGPMAFTDFIISGDPFAQITPWQFAATYNFDELAIITGDIATTDGDLRLDISSDDNLLVDATIASTTLTNSQGANSATLSNFSLSQSFDLNTLVRTIGAQGTYTSANMNGSVTFETRDDIVVMNDDNPSAGAMFISDNQSSVLITAIDSTNAQLEIDVDLDMMVDVTLVVAWSTIGLD